MASNNPDLKLTLTWTFKSLIWSHLFVLNLLQSGCGHFISNLSNKSNMSSLVNSSYSPLYVAVISVRVIQYYLRFYSIFRFSRTIVITPPPGPISINIYDPKLNRNITFLQDCRTADESIWQCDTCPSILLFPESRILNTSLCRGPALISCWPSFAMNRLQTAIMGFITSIEVDLECMILLLAPHLGSNQIFWSDE